MWKLEKIKIENFISHKETEINFNIGATTLVQGENLDDDGQESNGSGKSVILEAISYCLLGDSLKKVKDIELIFDKDDKVKYAYLCLFLNNTVSKQKLKIERWIHLKKSSELQVTLNNEVIINKDDKLVDDGNKLILEDLLQISREDILNFYLISKERYKSFFKSSDNDIKQIISRFSGAFKINGVEDLVERDASEKEQTLLKLQNKIIELDTKINIYTEEIANEDLERERQVLIDSFISNINNVEKNKVVLNSKIEIERESINSYKTQLATLEDNLSKKQRELLEFKDEKEAQKKIEDIKESVKKVDEKRKIIKNDIETLNAEIQEFTQFLTDTENNVAGAIKCPKCKFEFSLGNDEIDIEEARKSIPTIKEEINVLKVEVEKNKELSKQLSNEVEEFETYKSDYFKKIEQSNRAKSIIQNSINELEVSIKKYKRLTVQSEEDIKSYFLKIKKEQEQIITLQNKIEEAKNKKLESKAETYQTNIDSCIKSKNDITNQIEVLNEEKYNITQWITNFNKFRSHLANKAVKSIEGFSNFYLEKSDSNLQLQIEGYKTLSSGEIREKITPFILRNGFMSGSYGKLSEGEKARIEVATINALQTLINLNTNSGGLNFIGIDDVLGGLDSTGTKLIAKAFNNAKKTLYLFTHISIQSENSFNILTVVKEKGVSSIKN
jgi:exonuclease SbcC